MRIQEPRRNNGKYDVFFHSLLRYTLQLTPGLATGVSAIRTKLEGMGEGHDSRSQDTQRTLLKSLTIDGGM